MVLAQAGATDQVNFPVGKDVLLVDDLTGSFEILVDDLSVPTDVARDPFGRLLISDFADGSIWLLTPPPFPAGRVPASGSPLLVDHAPGEDLLLSWSPSCAAGDGDYEIYEGTIGTYYDHIPKTCSTGQSTSAQITPGPGSHYYLVVPTNGSAEGSYGSDGGGTERPVGASACRLQSIQNDCP